MAAILADDNAGMADPSRLDRALGALYGLAIGDALGMPTEGLDREQVRSRYGELAGFQPGAGNRGEFPAGRVTDDTEQAFLLGRLLVAGRGRVGAAELVAGLLDWEQAASTAGTGMLLGPSTRRALAAARAGVPLGQLGRSGTTNGAAMRVTPVGIAWPAQPLGRLVAAVVSVGAVTHDTGVAHAGAAAVAAAVSSGVCGAPYAESRQLAVAAAELTAGAGGPPDGAAVVARLRERPANLDAVAARGLGLATEESVPAAFALADLAPEDPWQVCRWAAGLGGDTDTIAAMAGAVLGAHAGLAGWPVTARETVRRVNSLDPERLAAGLLGVRAALC